MKLFIADPALSSFQGHHFSLTRTFSEAASKHDLHIIWLVSKRLPHGDYNLSGNVTIDRVFSEGTYDAYEQAKKSATLIQPPPKSRLYQKVQALYMRMPAPLRIMAKTVLRRITPFDRLFSATAQSHALQSPTKRQHEELMHALKKYPYSPEDSIFFHTSDAQTYFTIVELFVKSLPPEQWHTLPSLHLSTPYDEGIMPHNKTTITAATSIRYLRSLNLIDRQVFLYAENDLLAEHHSQQWSAPVKPLFIPQRPLPGEAQARPTQAITFSYLGAAREEKGFVYLAGAIEEFLAACKRDDVRFELQASPQIVGYAPAIKAAVDRLMSISDSRLHIITQPQSPADYDAALNRSDVLLLCYDPSRYAVRSSGIIFEALANGKIAITTDATFPSHIAQEAGLSVSYLSNSDFINCIMKIADNYDHYQKNAQARSRRFLEEVSPNKFFMDIRSGRTSAHSFEERQSTAIPAELPLGIPYRKLI